VRTFRMVLLITSIAACTGTSSNEIGHTIRDSAGVALVEISSQGLQSLPEWRLAEKPVATIGVTHGDPRYELYQVRNPTLLTDGRLALLNAGSNEVRFFGSSGQFIGSVGGPGEGPGEFVWPVALMRTAADTLRVFDARRRTMTVIAPTGTVVRLDGIQSSLSGLIGFVANDVVVTAEPTFTRLNVAALIDMPILVRLVSLKSGIADTIAVVGRAQQYQLIDGLERDLVPVPFTVFAQTRVKANTIAITDGVHPEVHVYDASGTLKRINRMRLTSEPVTDSEFRAAFEDELSKITHPGKRAAARKVFAELPKADVKPYFDQLVIDDNSNIWIQHFPNLNSHGDRRWTIVDQNGAPLARFALPRGMRIEYVGDSSLVASSRDEFGVEQIRVFAIERHASNK
jgi:hypothetical protein